MEAIIAALELVHAEQVGEGRHRDVYRLGDQAVTILKPQLRKDYKLFSVMFPAKLYGLLKYGSADLNKTEEENYRALRAALPREQHGMLTHIHKTGTFNGASYSVSDLVLNADGSVAQPLCRHGPVRDKGFWEQLASLERTLSERVIPYWEINEHDVVVQRTENGAQPKLVDYKRMGQRTYVFQPHLLFPKAIVGKIRRKFLRLKLFYQDE